MVKSNTNLSGNWYESDIAKNILSKKYYHPGEGFQEFIDRVSGIFTTEELRDRIRRAIIDGDFLLAGRTLYGAGCKGKFKASLSNCYILPSPEDNIESIFGIASKMARIFSMGGGCGLNISKLRPGGSGVNNAAKTSTGPTSFMEIFDKAGCIIGANNRRAALIIIMNCDHPDIEEFLSIKKNNDKIQSANISIAFTDAFMDAVRKNTTFNLYHKVESTGEIISKNIDAREFFIKFCEAQYDWAEPGAFFIDTVRNRHLLSDFPELGYHIDASNPCSEYTGSEWNACNLGSINLYNIVDKPFTKEASINYEKLEKLTQLGVIALDEVLDYGYDLQPLDENRKAIDDYRAIGLGFMGLADMFVALGLKYGSSKSLEVASKVISTMKSAAYKASHERGLDKGFFGKSGGKVPLRNASLLSIAPTGSLALMLGVSSGIEPYFKLAYNRTTHALEKEGVHFRVVAKAVQDFFLSKGMDIPADDKFAGYSWAVAAEDIHYKNRIEMQATIQKYVDNSISSTLNLPESATVEDIYNAYLLAHELGCKGLTVFREGCKRFNILGDSIKEEPIDTIKLNSKMPLKWKNYDINDFETKSVRASTACVPGMLGYVRFLDGKVFDIVVNHQKNKGGCASNIEGITRAASLAIRLGADVKEVTEELRASTCGHCLELRKQGKIDISKSCSNAIADMLDSAIKYRGVLGKPSDFTPSKGLVVPEASAVIVCPDCDKELRPEGKCWTCDNCGYNRCD